MITTGHTARAQRSLVGTKVWWSPGWKVHGGKRVVGSAWHGVCLSRATFLDNLTLQMSSELPPCSLGIRYSDSLQLHCSLCTKPIPGPQPQVLPGGHALLSPGVKAWLPCLPLSCPAPHRWASQGSPLSHLPQQPPQLPAAEGVWELWAESMGSLQPLLFSS